MYSDPLCFKKRAMPAPAARQQRANWLKKDTPVFGSIQADRHPSK
jgi:hypothetical protein